MNDIITIGNSEIQVTSISGIDCYERDGTAYLKLDTVARGLGFTRIAESGNEVVRWERVDGYLRDLGVPTCGHDDFIPENIFYRLAMKAKNEAAEAFQAKIADEVIPAIRKTGGYNPKPMTAMQMLELQVQVNKELSDRIDVVENNQKRIAEACSVPAVGRDEWQENMKKYLSGLCEEYSMSYPIMYDDLYSALERKLGCNLATRQSNMRKRLKDAGATYKERQSVSKLTVIAKDPSLTGVFEGIVQRYAAHLASRKWETA